MTAPNIVLFVFDDCSFENLQRMPQLAKLGLTGINFLNAYSNTPLCQPARVTLLSGQYSHNHGVLDNDLTGFPLDHTTLLARRLQLAGYKTSHVGKYFNSWPIASAIPSGWNDWHQMTEMYAGYQINDNGVVTTAGASLAEYNTNACTNRALTFMAGATQPFFLQVAYKAPHPEQSLGGWPAIVPDPRYSGVTPGSRTAPRNPNFNVAMGTPPAYMAHAAMSGGDITNVDAFYRGQTEAMYSADRSIQAIVAAAPANTVFIVTSDHGFMRGEGIDPQSKMVPYLQDLHIPFIVSGPSSLVAQGKVCSRLVSHVDITATIYALSGATSARVADGISMAPLLANPSGAALRNSLLLEFLGTSGYPTANSGSGWLVKVPAWSSILTASFLYTRYATAEEELYDLVADPYQLANLAGVAAYAGKRANMAAQLTAMQACAGAACVV